MAPSAIGLESAEIAKSLQAQLDVIGAALNASDDGFAIWKSIEDTSGAIVDFELVLINTAGATKASRPQNELVGKSLSLVVDAISANELKQAFSRALREGHAVREVVQGFSAARGPGLFENTVVPFGKNLVFTTYRDVSEAERPDLSRGLLELGVKFAELVDADVIVEKVETQSDLDLAKEVGARYAQGWLFGQPVDLRTPEAKA